MIYLQLFQVFFVIGLFCFGGGYAILPFIQDSVVGNGWITVQEFGDMIAVSQSTPGPVSINMATFVGYKLAGIPGAVCATFALALPAFILMLTVVKLLYTDKGSAIMDRLLVGIQPVVVGMIFFAGWEVAKSVLFETSKGAPLLLNPLTVAIAVAAFVLSHRFKVSAIKLIVASALIGLAVSVF